MNRTVAVSLLALVPALVHADQVVLKTGGEIKGEIVERRADALVMEVGPGRLTLPMASVARVVSSTTDLGIYRARAGHTGARGLRHRAGRQSGERRRARRARRRAHGRPLARRGRSQPRARPGRVRGSLDDAGRAPVAAGRAGGDGGGEPGGAR